MVMIQGMCSDDDGHGAYSNNDIGIDPEASNENVYSPTNDVRVTQYPFYLQFLSDNIVFSYILMS
jgi:hypothetical protein